MIKQSGVILPLFLILGGNVKHRIIHRKDFYIIGLKKRITLIFEGENNQIDSLYKALDEKKRRRLLALNDVEPKGILNVSANFSDRTRENSELDQYLGVASRSECSDDFSSLHIEESDWAIFPSRGKYPEALQQTWAKIYAEWLPSSDYNLTGGAEILWTEDGNRRKPDFKSETWIPIRKKEKERF